MFINEELARRAKQNMSFSDYKPGSATAEYNAQVSEVTAMIEKAKGKVSEAAQERLDKLLSRYKAKYAEWINKRNSNGANHASVMICGPANYNMRAHQKYLKREDALWKEYEWFKNIEWHISAIVRGDKIIKSGDADAIEKLQSKIAKLEKMHERMKAANAILRKKKLTDAEKVENLMQAGFSESAARELLQPDFCGRIGFSYQLSNNNANIRSAKQRLERLQRERARGTTETVIESAESAASVRIVDNVEAARLQVFFPDKPDAEVRTQLKKNGFRWAPSIGAWQAYRSERAYTIAQQIAKTY